MIEAETWAADSKLAAHRTSRLIRACDPECYRIYLSVNGRVRGEQADNQVAFRAGDIGLYDMSCPAVATHPAGLVQMRDVTLSFPRALVPVARAAIRPLLGTVMPRNLPGRSVFAEFMTGLTGTLATAGQQVDPDLADVLRECTVRLIRQWLGQPDGVTPRTQQLRTTRIRAIIGQHLGDPGLGPDQFAQDFKELFGVSARQVRQLASQQLSRSEG